MYLSPTTMHFFRDELEKQAGWEGWNAWHRSPALKLMRKKKPTKIKLRGYRPPGEATTYRMRA